MKRFLLDDIRNIDDVQVVCRRAIEAFKVLEKEGFDVYIFDHDLGDTKPGTSGYDVLKWALEQGKLKEDATIILATSNPVGRLNMGYLLSDYGYTQSGIVWNKGEI